MESTPDIHFQPNHCFATPECIDGEEESLYGSPFEENEGRERVLKFSTPLSSHFEIPFNRSRTWQHSIHLTLNPTDMIHETEFSHWVELVREFLSLRCSMGQ